MIDGVGPIQQALLGTLFTWGVTALGAAAVFVVPKQQSASAMRSVLDLALGFSGGVMIAASVWSLLLPAFEFAESAPAVAAFEGRAWLPVSLGFLAGGAFVWFAGKVLPEPDANAVTSVVESLDAMARANGEAVDAATAKRLAFEARRSWRRVLLLVVAITVHNFPEGLAVGVGFGAIGTSPHATFSAARTLAIGIGLQVSPSLQAAAQAPGAGRRRSLAVLQNFPEGLAVSLPLMRAGYSRWRAFWFVVRGPAGKQLCPSVWPRFHPGEGLLVCLVTDASHVGAGCVHVWVGG